MNVKCKKPQKKMEMKIRTKGQERHNLEGSKEGQKEEREEDCGVALGKTDMERTGLLDNTHKVKTSREGAK